MDINRIYDELSLQIEKGRMVLNASMKEYTSFKAGGNAALLLKPADMEELTYAIRLLNQYDINHLIIGNGTNILVKDSGYSGVVIRIGEQFSKISVKGNIIEVEAGALLSAIAKEAWNESLTGFEFAGGIPGTIGGAVFMNAGAYDGEISQIIQSAEVISADGSEIRTINKEDMKLSYRHSIFQDTKDIIIKAVLKLEPGNQQEISTRMRELTARRTEKQPLSYPSAGSFFKRPPGNFAGKLIQEAGLRGLTLGGAQVSTLHAGFIINIGGATASDIINLMEVVRNTVYDQYKVMLEPEVRIIGD